MKGAGAAVHVREEGGGSCCGMRTTAGKGAEEPYCVIYHCITFSQAKRKDKGMVLITATHFRLQL
ncbi:hypothetical protein PAHAL_4G344300 [Panicum hallii]|uniref:Uncharacterized protein n=1 Tax=Panicum hallii TaxID=206008 RepID=A0A2S3HKB1_9POAL|nr:hypothetical protein PAHAL_4G344300 [Panicum hallii]